MHSMEFVIDLGVVASTDRDFCMLYVDQICMLYVDLF